MYRWLARHPELDDVFQQLIEADGGVGASFQSLTTFGSDQIISSTGVSISVKMSSSTVLNDLASAGLLRARRRTSRGEVQFELPASARDFARWRAGLPSPVQRVEAQVSRLIDDEGFAERHPSAAKHLRLAFEFLDRDQLDVVDLTITGDHLRKALIDVAGAAAGLADPDEKLERVLKPQRVSAAARADTATAMLIDLTLAVLATTHAIEHVRDEVTEGRQPANLETTRRAAFLTAVCCYELDRSPMPSGDGE
jgi:hypothetical protein